MRLGKLNQRITLRRAVPGGRNALNEPIEIRADFGGFWAERLQQRPKESQQAGQTAAQTEVVLRTRWSQRVASITPSDRIICGGQEFQIIGVTEIGRRLGIEIVGIGYSEEGLRT